AVLGAGELELPGRQDRRIRRYGVGGKAQGGGARRRSTRDQARRRRDPPRGKSAGVGLRARGPRAAAGAAPGARGARARDRYPREPTEGGGEADRIARRGNEGGRIPDVDV